MSLPLPSWDLVRVFLAVMREGSLSAAARTLKLSQPTVRRQIAELEGQLGTALFSRSLTGLIPTDVAHTLTLQAEAAEAAIGAFQRGGSDPLQEASGVVRVTCPDLFGVEILPEMLAGLLAKHQSLAIELAASNQLDDLLRRAADVAVRLAPPQQAALIAKKVRKVELGLFAAPSYFKSHPAPKTTRELIETSRFVGDDRKDVIARGFAGLKLPLPRRIVFRSDNDLAQLAAIRRGVGIGVCQSRIAKASGLTRVLPHMSVNLDCWVVMHEDLKAFRRVRLVFEHLVVGLSKA